MRYRPPRQQPRSYRGALLGSLLAGLLVTVTACGGHGDEAGGQEEVETPSPQTGSEPEEIFTDKASESGLDFFYANGMTGEFYIVEVTGAGCGMLDYDNDGDLDLYLIQGNVLGPGKGLEDAIFPPPDGVPLRDRLFRNDLVVRPDGRRELRFTDVTEQAGLDVGGYGMGLAAGDYDNDGWIDLYVTQFGPNRLFHNNGDGTFTDVTQQAGVEDERWSVPATFVDFDRDGWLDLFVGNYLDFSYETHKTCLSVTGAQDYCGPAAYGPLPDRLWRNRGDGTFVDVTHDAGIHTAYGPALGAVVADLDADGLADLYVTNDGQPNQMWINQGDGTFTDEALLAGAAVSGEGLPEASMGVLAADFNGDGDDDLFMTHIAGETNTFYENQGGAMFRDSSIGTGLGSASKWATGFGTAALDYDNDGWLDILTVNGAVRTIEELARQQDPYPLRQPNQLFHNLGGGRFEEVSERAGAAFEEAEVSRGVAYGDIDNDGDTDVLITNSNGPADLLVNNVGHRSHWLGLRVLTGKRDALGARVGVFRPDRPPLWRRVATDGSYAAANDPRVLFGLGGDTEVEKVRVVFSDGAVEEFTGVEADRYTQLSRGSGTPVP